MEPHKRSTAEDDDRFIAALLDGASTAEACRLAGYRRTSVYRRARSDHVFARRWEAAEELHAARLSLRLAEKGLTLAAIPKAPKPDLSKLSDGQILGALRQLAPDRYGPRGEDDPPDPRSPSRVSRRKTHETTR